MIQREMNFDGPIVSYLSMPVHYPMAEDPVGKFIGKFTPDKALELEFTDAKMIKRGEHELVGPDLPMITGLGKSYASRLWHIDLEKRQEFEHLVN